MNFDLVSDLHIDFWGEQFQKDWLKYQTSDTLVIAGDVSDYVDMTCEYVDSLHEYYDTVIIVDGNHEHQPQFPLLESSVVNWRHCIAQTRAHYLGDSKFDHNGVRFIGVNGWWSFDFGAPNVSKEDCISNFLQKTTWGKEAAKQQELQGLRDAFYLQQQMIQAQHEAEHIVVVTHSLPHPSCISWGVYPDDNKFVGLYGNSRYQWTLDADVDNKMAFWCFGHNHDCKDIPYKNARLRSNPRGRPKDWNREEYKPLRLEI